MSDPAETKQQLRQAAKARRKQLDMAYISQAVRQHIASWPLFINARTVLTYAALPDEINLLLLTDPFSQKHWYLPKVTGEGQLSFFPYQSGDPLRPNVYGIAEPVVDENPLADVTAIDLIFVPALMLDKAGYRLGYGKGFYDQFIAQCPKTVQTVCAVPEALIVDQLPQEPWDLPVHWGITEGGISDYRQIRQRFEPA